MTNEEIALKIAATGFAKIQEEYIIFETLNNTSKVSIKNLKEEISCRAANCLTEYWSDESLEDHLFWEYVDEWINNLG